MAKRILVVDDAADIRKTLKEMLTTFDVMDVVSVATGGEALDTLKQQSFDLIILDIELPDINGKKLLDRINGFDIPPPIVMCSAFNSVDNVQKTWEMGAKGFLAKPIDASKLKNLLERVGIL